MATKKAKPAIKETIDQRMGIIMAHCVAQDLVCLMHPRYTAKKAPSTKRTFKDDGCTCHIYWALNKELRKIAQLRAQSAEANEAPMEIECHGRDGKKYRVKTK